jgi:chorismate mutase
MRSVRGIRGAIKISANSREAILNGAKELVAAMTSANDIELDEVAAAYFTVTTDLDAEFPALAARQLGWLEVPMLCAREIDVPGSMKSVLRILVLVNTDKSQSEIVHQFLGEAAGLRPDLHNGGGA